MDFGLGPQMFGRAVKPSKMPCCGVYCPPQHSPTPGVRLASEHPTHTSQAPPQTHAHTISTPRPSLTRPAPLSPSPTSAHCKLCEGRNFCHVVHCRHQKRRSRDRQQLDITSVASSPSCSKSEPIRPCSLPPERSACTSVLVFSPALPNLYVCLCPGHYSETWPG